MPTIPQFVGHRQLTTEAPAVKKSAELEAGLSKGGALKDAGELLAYAKKEFDDLRDTNLESDAKIYAAEKRAALKDKIDSDPDSWQDYNKIKAEDDKIINEASSKYRLGNLESHNRMKSDLEMSGFNFRTGVQSELRKQQIESAKVRTGRDLALVGDELARIYDPTQRDAVKESMRRRIEANGKIYNPADKEKVYYDAIKDSAELSVYYDPETALKELKKGNGGVFSDVLPEDRTRLIRNAETTIKHRAEIKKLQAEQDNVDLRFNTIAKITSGEINDQNINQIAESIALSGDTELATELKRVYATAGRYESSSETIKQYTELADGLFKNKDQKSVANWLVQNLKTIGAKPGDERLTALIDVAKEYAKELDLKSGKSNTNSWWPKVWNQAKEHIKVGIPPILVFDTFKDIVSAYKNDPAVGNVLQIASTEFNKLIERVQPQKTKYLKGDKVTNNAGNTGEVVGHNKYGEALIKWLN